MGKVRQIGLTEDLRAQLIGLRNSGAKAYVRERVAAILKVEEGIPAAEVARTGLLRPRAADTVYDWLNRFETSGIEGLYIRPGRGRKPAFSPSVPGPSRR